MLSSLWLLVLLARDAWAQTQCPAIIGNCYVFPPTDEWNRPIDSDPVDYQSSCVMPGVVDLTDYLRLDLGTEASQPYGMLYNIYPTDAPCLNGMAYGVGGADYQDESEWFTVSSVAQQGQTNDALSPAYYPFPSSAVIEGSTPSSPNPNSGDRHVIVVDAVNCYLYESWNSERTGSTWKVSNTAVWDLEQTNKQRPAGWTSADAAGMAIFPGILRYSEIDAAIADGTMTIPHALRFTAPTAQAAYANPGRHFGPTQDVTKPWYGSRYRLQSSFSTTPYATHKDTMVLLNTLKKYGLIFADQGSGPWITCENNASFATTLLPDINQGDNRIAWSNFELVQPPEAITRDPSWSVGTVSCSGQTQNSNPTWTPTWNPTCPDPPGPPDPSLRTPPPAGSTRCTFTDTGPPKGKNSGSSSGSNAGAVAGGVLGTFAALGVIGGAAFYYKKSGGSFDKLMFWKKQ